VADSLARRLRSRKVQVLVVKSDAEDALSKVSAWLQEGEVHGLYFLPALDSEPSLDEMTPQTWQAEVERRAGLLYALVRALPGQPFVLSATRLGGLHGYTAEGASSPLGGLVSGFTKALAQEREGALVKVVDFSAETPAASVAGCLIDETLQDPGSVEIGYEEGQRFGIELIEQSLDETQVGFTWDAQSVFLVSGGAGGITVPVVLDLARARGGVFYLLGRTPLPERDSADLVKLAADRNAFRQEMTRRMTEEGGKKPTPTQVESRLQSLERAAAALHLLDELAKTGSRAQYLVCDVSNPDAARQVVEQVLASEGKVDVFLHAAGMERSRKLENKPAEEFNQTIAVKAHGFFNVYHVLQQHGKLPRAVVFFTSVAGRFGNTGQTDYSAANDLLCKLASALPHLHPEMKVLALDWGAWAEVGMAARGNIPRLMEYAGIEMLKPDEAAPMVRVELQYGASGEVLLAGALGLLLKPRHVSGGVNMEYANLALIQGNPQHVMLARLTGYNPHEGILLEAELDPQTEPFLKDHARNGTSLLPGVIGIEGFMMAAQHIASALAAGKGGFYVDRLEDIQFRVPFKFYRNEPRRITWKAQVVRESSGLVAYASLESDLTRRSGRVEHYIHFTGKVHLRPQPAQQGIKVDPPYWNGSKTVGAEDIYRLYFHGPSFQVLEGVQRSGERVIGKLSTQRPPLTRQAGGHSDVPILVELCLQTAGVWEIGATGKLALPHSIGRLVVYNAQAEGATVYAEVIPSYASDGSLRFDARVVDEQGKLYLEISDYRTARVDDPVDDALLDPMKALINGDEG
jgi:NAD(P)-dependent dehydrogenase (short-subunit alcohol dehydrogenase family)